MSLRFPIAAVLLSASIVGCGGREGTGSTSASDDAGTGGANSSDADSSTMGPDSGKTDSSTDATSALPDGSRIVPSGISTKTGECETASDCKLGNSGEPQCAEVVPGGYRVCVYQAPVVTKPSTNPADQCDGNKPCAKGACYAGLAFPSGVCGLGGASGINMCLSDKCASDADCAGGICGPRGLVSDNNFEGGFIRQCFQVDCHSNADCTEHPQGVCALVAGGCPNTPGFRIFRPARLACVYPDGCFTNSDCKQGSCTIVGGSGWCVVTM